MDRELKRMVVEFLLTMIYVNFQNLNTRSIIKLNCLTNMRDEKHNFPVVIQCER
jgi:hypothetical protein